MRRSVTVQIGDALLVITEAMRNVRFTLDLQNHTIRKEGSRT